MALLTQLIDKLAICVIPEAWVSPILVQIGWEA